MHGGVRANIIRLQHRILGQAITTGEEVRLEGTEDDVHADAVDEDAE